MARRAAHRITRNRVYCAIEIRASIAERIVTCKAQFLARFPPSMLTNDDASIELIIQPSYRSHAARGRRHDDPCARSDAALTCRVRVQFHFGMRCAPPQAR